MAGTRGAIHRPELSKVEVLMQMNIDKNDSRGQILQKLRAAQRPFPDAPPPPTEYRPVVPRINTDVESLTAQFVTAAEQLGCVVHKPATATEGVAVLLELIGEDTAVFSWHPDHIPLTGFATALADNDIKITEARDADARIGITGASAALAATGSLVLASGSGDARAASLLPPVHIAIIHRDQIIPDLENWFAQYKETNLDNMRQASNIVIISGPSRTADIALQMVMGMHGPRSLHIILLDNKNKFSPESNDR